MCTHEHSTGESMTGTWRRLFASLTQASLRILSSRIMERVDAAFEAYCKFLDDLFVVLERLARVTEVFNSLTTATPTAATAAPTNHPQASSQLHNAVETQREFLDDLIVERTATATSTAAGLTNHAQVSSQLHAVETKCRGILRSPRNRYTYYRRP
ncbi:hypothetical protein M011DRAFT_116768 [Sporormia fimetaria CBS 119925]|uniref:Uncharacterized protein n=1 Tax=Sporormia fimetaria CBS 119925 TaxID=1340428 RepID=A0A6A6VLQ8_9PLEO|nr:hypothetical protein M011DRAFT_116768 [Sporormia fimetaria CBS 119925]